MQTLRHDTEKLEEINRTTRLQKETVGKSVWKPEEAVCEDLNDTMLEAWDLTAFILDWYSFIFSSPHHYFRNWFDIYYKTESV